jgi:hypothetical protein
MFQNKGGRRTHTHKMVGASIDFRERQSLSSVLRWVSTYTSLYSLYWEMGVLEYKVTPILSLIQILEHPRFRLGRPQVLNSGCVSFDNSGGRITGETASSVRTFGKFLNTLFHIVFGKIHVWGSLWRKQEAGELGEWRCMKWGGATTETCETVAKWANGSTKGRKGSVG